MNSWDSILIFCAKHELYWRHLAALFGCYICCGYPHGLKTPARQRQIRPVHDTVNEPFVQMPLIAWRRKVRHSVRLRTHLFTWLLAVSATCNHSYLAASAQQSSKTPVQQPVSLESAGYPRLVDITRSTGITFEHNSSPEQKYIVESMSGGVALIDYDADGWQDIYFTNSQSVSMALSGEKARSAL